MHCFQSLVKASMNEDAFCSSTHLKVFEKELFLQKIYLYITSVLTVRLDVLNKHSFSSIGHCLCNWFFQICIHSCEYHFTFRTLKVLSLFLQFCYILFSSQINMHPENMLMLFLQLFVVICKGYSVEIEFWNLSSYKISKETRKAQINR